MKCPRFFRKFRSIVDNKQPTITAPGPSIEVMERTDTSRVWELLNQLEDLEDRHIHRDDHRADDAAEDQDHDGLK